MAMHNSRQETSPPRSNSLNLILGTRKWTPESVMCPPAASIRASRAGGLRKIALNHSTVSRDSGSPRLSIAMLNSMTETA